MLSEFLKSFITFFAVIDPIGTIPVFIAISASRNTSDRRRIAGTAVMVSAAVLIFFVLIGEIVLEAIEIQSSTVLLAGGIILFIFALMMIFGESKPEDELKQATAEADVDKAIFPLALPSLASPGAILAAVLLTKNSESSIPGQAFTIISMLAVLLIAWVFMLLSVRISGYIGKNGAIMSSRVMGIILAVLAMAKALEGFRIQFNIS